MLTRTPYSKGAGSAGPPVVDPSVRAVPSALYTVLPHTNNGTPAARTASRTCTECSGPAWKSKFYGAFVLNHRVVLHAIDAPPARWRGDAGSSSLDGAGTAASSPRNDLVKNYRVRPTHWLISTQIVVKDGVERDLKKIVNMNVLLLKNLLATAQQRGVRLRVDTSVIEDEALLRQVDALKLTGGSFSPAEPKGPSASFDDLTSKEEQKALERTNDRLVQDNTTLQKDLRRLQAQSEQAARDQALRWAKLSADWLGVKVGESELRGKVLGD